MNSTGLERARLPNHAAVSESLRKLSPEQKRTAKAAFHIFKVNPFDPRLGTHRIHRLSGIMKRTVYAVEVEADLHAVSLSKIFVFGKEELVSATQNPLDGSGNCQMQAYRLMSTIFIGGRNG